MKSGRIWLWGLLAYFFSLIDDNPLNADMLLGLGYGFYAMELSLRSLTLACFYLAAREATGRRSISWKTLMFTGLAFLSTSADDLRYLLGFGFIFDGPWAYPAVLIFQTISLFFFLLAVRSGKSSVG